MNNCGIGAGGCCLAVGRQPSNEGGSINARKKYDNQRRLYAYFPHLPKEKLLIVDTSEARQKAISEGATHFDTLSFSRNPYTEIPQSCFYGDLYINVFEPDRLNERNQFQFLKQIVSQFFAIKFRIDSSLIRFILFESGGLGFRIPAWVLGLEAGAYLLPYFYRQFASLLDGYCKCLGLDRCLVQFSPKIAASSLYPDLQDSDDLCPFTFEEEPDNPKRISMAGISKIRIETQRQKENELIAKRFQHCQFLRHQLRCIPETKDRITDLDEIPVYGKHSVPPKFLRGILLKINQELRLGASMQEWITPGFASICEHLQTVNRCKSEMSSRCHFILNLG